MWIPSYSEIGVKKLFQAKQYHDYAIPFNIQLHLLFVTEYNWVPFTSSTSNDLWKHNMWLKPIDI